MNAIRTLAHGALSLACAAIAACSDGHPGVDADVSPIPYEVTIGVPGSDGGVVEFATGEMLPMHLGFQGFVFASIVFVAHGDAPAFTPARSTLAIEGESSVTQNYARIDLVHESNGFRYSNPVLLFANDILLRSGQQRPFVLQVVLDDGTHRATGSIDGVIGFDATCVDDGDGGCVPGDAGSDGAVDAEIDASSDAWVVDVEDSGTDASLADAPEALP